MNFSQILLDWYCLNKRDLPWRKTHNPYFIWLSEIILQQTRVEQGLPYYLKFIHEFPTVIDLAQSKEDRVLKIWQGLGYYSRARNLHFSAKYIMENYQGKFPKEYNEILNLKGIGEYTAAAISSFSFGLPYAVVDSNVVRVLSRYFGIDMSFDTSLGKSKYRKLAQDLLDKQNHAENNQAIMDFGAIQCTPKSPKCDNCPFILNCVAYNTNSINKFPVRNKKNNVKKRFLNYLFINTDNHIVLDKRGPGVWQGLYDFPFLEFSVKKNDEQVMFSNEWMRFFNNIDYKIESVSDEYMHKLSHQHIFAKFWKINVKRTSLCNHNFIKKSSLKNYPVSILTDKFLRENDMI